MRADALTLYGFSTGTEKRAFDLLMSVQHVGPKLAFTILSVLAPEELVAAIANGDVERIDSVPGGDLKLVASSTAQINGPTRAATPGNRIPAGSLEEAISALVNLGMKPVEAKRTVEDVVAEDPRPIAVTVEKEHPRRGCRSKRDIVFFFLRRRSCWQMQRVAAT